MNKRNFKMITAFSPSPFLLRKRIVLSLLFLTLCIVLTESFIESKYIYLTVILSSAFNLYIGIMFIKYKNSLEYSLKSFIIKNKLYTNELSAEVGYLVTNENITIRFQKNADLYTECAGQFIKHFEALLDLPVQDIVNKNTYCDYIFEKQPDERLKFSSREVKDNTIRLTEKISWKFSKPCHTLICGATNSGKTYFATMLIPDYLRIKGKGGGCDIYICDPKSADLAIICRRIDLKKYGKVQHLAVTEEEISTLLKGVNVEMERRYSEWFKEDINAFGKTWVNIESAKPIVVVIDELSAVLSVASPKVAKEITGYFNSLLLKGRMVGIEIVLIMQRPDVSSNGLTGQQRDQFGVRVAMGNMSNDGRRMIFGNSNTEFQTVKEIGAGYIMIDGKHIKPVYFEAPLLPKNSADYLDYLDKAILENMAL